MTRGAVTSRSRWFAVALVGVLGLGIWLAREHGEPGQEPRAPKREPIEMREEPDEVVTSLDTPTVPARVSVSPQKHDDAPTATAGAAVGAHPRAPHLPGMLPHPEGDPERRRLHAENQLLQRLNDAMSFRRVAEMRRLILEYQKLDPSDVHSNVAGYSLIADCIEFPGDRALAAARAFYAQRRHSPLRRYVRRVCFENTN